MAFSQSLFLPHPLSAAGLEQLARALGLPCAWDGFGWKIEFDGTDVWLEEGTEDIEDMPEETAQASTAWNGTGSPSLQGRVAIVLSSDIHSDPDDDPRPTRIARVAAETFGGVVLHDHRGRASKHTRPTGRPPGDRSGDQGRDGT